MERSRSSRQEVADDTTREGAPAGQPFASTVDASGELHDSDEIEKADGVAIGVEVPATVSSEQQVVGKLPEHPNPSRLIPHPCTVPARADSEIALAHSRRRPQGHSGRRQGPSPHLKRRRSRGGGSRRAGAATNDVLVLLRAVVNALWLARRTLRSLLH